MKEGRNEKGDKEKKENGRKGGKERGEEKKRRKGKERRTEEIIKERRNLFDFALYELG